MLLMLLLFADLAGLAPTVASSYDFVTLGVFVLFWGLGLALAAAGRPSEEQGALVRLFTLSFLLRVAAAIVVYRFGLLDILGDEDSSGWFGGWAIAQAWRGDPAFAAVQPDFAQALQQTNLGYQYLAGVFLYLIGVPSRLSLAMLSALAGALTVALIYKIGSSVFGREAAGRAATWAVIFPSLVIWSGQTLKEPFIILFECAVVYAVMGLRDRASLKLVGLLLGSLFSLYTMRFYAAYVSAAAAVLILMWPQRGHRRTGSLAVAAAVFSVTVIAMFGLGLWTVETERLSQFNLGWVQTFRAAVTTGPGSGSAIPLPYDVSTLGGLLLAFPASAAGFLLSPYPWQALGGSLRLQFALLDVALWWCLIPSVLAGLREAWRRQRAAAGALMLFIVPLTVFYSILFGNAGLAFRERAQVLVLLLVFAGLGLVLRKQAAFARPVKRALEGGLA